MTQYIKHTGRDSADSKKREVEQAVTNGAAHVETKTGSQWAYGNWPNTLYANGSVVGAGAGTLATLTNLESYNRHTINLDALTATSLDVYVSVDGTNFEGPILLLNVSTGVQEALDGVGSYVLKGKYKSIRLDQVGVNALTAQYAHWVE